MGIDICICAPAALDSSGAVRAVRCTAFAQRHGLALGSGYVEPSAVAAWLNGVTPCDEREERVAQALCDLIAEARKRRIKMYISR